MQVYYYCPEVDGLFYELGSCLVAAVSRAKYQQSDVDVYRLVEYEDGQQKSIYIATISPSKEL